MSTDIVIVCIFFAGPIRGYSPGGRVNNFYSHGSQGNSHFVHVNGCPRIPRVTFDCGVERIDLQVYAANFMHHAWPFSSFSRKFPATRVKIPAWSLRVPRKIHASSEALLRGKIEIFTQDTWKLDLSRRWYCIVFDIYIFPLLSPTLSSTSMHASTPLPSPPLGCPTLFYPPFPYSHYPSSPLHYHRIPPLNSAALSFPTLSYTLPFPRTPPLRCPIIPLASSTYPLLILHSPTLT